MDGLERKISNRGVYSFTFFLIKLRKIREYAKSSESSSHEGTVVEHWDLIRENGLIGF